MASEIRPLHQIEGNDYIFEHSLSLGYSDLQGMFLENTSNQKTAAKYADGVLEMLEQIHNSENSLITTASNYLTKNSDTQYDVPIDINDNSLLYLKTQGLVVGSGRVVKITDAGKNAIKSKWLSETNKLKKSSFASNKFSKVG